MKVLITSGGTREPIDEVRYISNFSTGKTGARLADILSENNWEVTYVYSQGAAIPKCNVNLIEYITFKDLNNILRKKLGEESFDVIIHASAVSDYGIDRVLVDGKSIECLKLKKISSDSDLTIKLKKNPKIIAALQDYSLNKKIQIVGFKLTNTSDENHRLDKIKIVSEYQGVSLVVHNDMSDIVKNKRIFNIYQKMNLVGTMDSINLLGDALNVLLRKELV